MSSVNNKETIENKNIESFDSNQLSLFDRLKAANELKETQEKTTECLMELHTLLKENDIANGLHINNSFLIQFIRHSKHDTKKAYSRLTKFIKFWMKHNDFFTSLPKEYYLKPSSKLFTILPKRSPDGCAIIFTQLALWDPDELSERQAQHILHSSLLYSLENPKTQINGIIIVGDVKNASLQQIRCCTPSAVLFLCNLGLNCIPARYSEIHFLNSNLFLKIFWMLTRPLLPEKLRQRCYFHSEPTDILKFLPAAVLPEEYGGELSEYHSEERMLAANEYMAGIFKEV